MGRIAVQRDAGRLAHLRAAAVGADDQATTHAPALAIERVLHRCRCGIGGDAHVGDPAPDRRARLHRLIRHHLAERGMADAERAGDVGEQRREIERHGRCHLRRQARLRRPVGGEMMAAGGADGVVELERLQLDDAPRRHPFAAHVVAVDGALLQHQRGVPGARQGGRERAAADSTADDHDIEAFIHGAAIRCNAAYVNRAWSRDATR